MEQVTVDDFEIRENVEQVLDLTPQILFNLFDITTKWGTLRAGGMVSFPANFPEEGIGFLIAVHPQTKGMFVAKEAKSLGPGMYAAEDGMFLITLENEAMIMWDRRITAKEAAQAIKKVDELVSEYGWIDQEGERIQLPQVNVGQTWWRVKDVFQKPTDIFIIPPDSVEKVILRFDHPELLEIGMLGPLTFICLREGREIMERRKVLLEAQLAVEGKSLSDIIIEYGYKR